MAGSFWRTRCRQSFRYCTCVRAGGETAAGPAVPDPGRACCRPWKTRYAGPLAARSREACGWPAPSG
eukprot:90394-Alexandrium_andersonii.AAC.1